jgi:Uncharacterized conserved protein
LLLSEIHNYEINQRGKELKDEDIIQIIQKEIKKRKEAREIFLKGNRSDLASQAEEEIKILSLYVPPPISKEEILETGYRARIRNHGHSCFLCEIVIRSQFHTTYEPEA